MLYLYHSALCQLFLTTAAITSNSVTAFILTVFGEEVLVCFVSKIIKTISVNTNSFHDI